MGQKVNPHGLRVGVIKDWDSKWYAEEDFADCLIEDYNIRKFLKNKLYNAGVSKIEIERQSDRVKVTLYTAKPGVVIGKGGAEIEKVKSELQKQVSKKLIVDISACCGEHCFSAREPCFLPPRNEVLHGTRNEVRSSGNQDLRFGTSRRCRHGSYRVLQRGNNSASDFESGHRLRIC